jgi:protein TonB
MTIDYHVGFHPGAPAEKPAAGRGTTSTESWRYAGVPRSRALIAIALVLSASVHAAIFFGFRRSTHAAPAKPKEELLIRLTPMPEVQELEQPETVARTDEPAPDIATLVPMQQDLPQLPQPADFVQQINFATLLEQPDFSQVSVYAIPENIRAAGSNLAEKIGKIFNPEELDRVPTAIFQPAPVYPHSLRREGLTATVLIEFVVDVDGRLLAPVVAESTHSGFNDAAVVGVARWKFRPGVRDGRKVNTRMRVPIVFTVSEPEPPS